MQERHPPQPVSTLGNAEQKKIIGFLVGTDCWITKEKTGEIQLCRRKQ